MSSVISKFLLAGATGGLLGDKTKMCNFAASLGNTTKGSYDVNTFKEGFNSKAAAIAYFGAHFWDFIDFLRGDTKYITTRDENGNSITKQYKVYEFDAVSTTCNIYSLMGSVAFVLGKNDIFATTLISTGAIGQILADLFNVEARTEILCEINGDKVIVINDF